MSPLYSEFLMGHRSGGLAIESYTSPTEKDLLEGNDKMIGYIGVIDALTINEEHKLKREVETLHVNKSEMEEFRQELEKLKELLFK